jgi:hypothetical protein
MEHYTIYNGKIKCKRRHDTFEIAMNNALKFNSNKNNLGKSKMSPYRCNKCKGFHLGRQPNSINKNTLNKSIIKAYSGVLAKIKFNIDLSVFDKKSNSHPKLKRQKKIKPIITKDSFYFKNGVWEYHIRLKTVKITKSDGTVNIHKIINITKDKSSEITSKEVKDFIKATY